MKGFLWKLLFGNYKSNYKKRYNKYKNQNKIEKNIKYMSDGEIKIKRIMNKEENQIYYTILKIFKNSYNINTQVSFKAFWMRNMEQNLGFHLEIFIAIFFLHIK